FGDARPHRHPGEGRDPVHGTAMNGRDVLRDRKRCARSVPTTVIPAKAGTHVGAGLLSARDDARPPPRGRRSAHTPKATACFEVHGSRPVPACSLSLASGAGMTLRMTSRWRHRDDVMVVT